LREGNMPEKYLDKVQKRAHAMTMNKWSAIIAKEIGLEVQGENPTERMWHIIGQLKKKDMGVKKRKRIRRKLHRKWASKDWRDYRTWK